jgi:2-dehydro-3-deoxyphosphogluconate aldolase / (4S)-4-hydroxy-2-oxoglutarate aldolase
MALLKMAVARGIDEADLIPAFSACIAGGFNHLEVTMNTPDAEKLIKLACRKLKGLCTIGAGTVRTMDDLEAALDAGAQFIVSPVTDTVMIVKCRQLGIPVYPGALTPTEILKAWDAGATMVKVFPIGSVDRKSVV